jgi:3-dehydroquinate synthase
VVERSFVTQGGEPVSEIVIGRSVLRELEGFLPRSPSRRRVAILTQPPVAELADMVVQSLRHSYQTSVHVCPDREAAKTLTEAERVYLWFNELGLTRHDTVVAVGGGALTDLAGFVAATYLRGVEAIMVPTTLLGAVDASVGGKTAINVGGKNLAGVFRHPARVIIDLEVLEALPEPLLREGAAEALKTGLIADPVLVEAYENEGMATPLEFVVGRSVAVKARVVSDDFTEAGGRAHLNYGHTVGHAVETLSGWSHGESVAVGMVAAGAVSEQVAGFGEADRQRAVIAGLGLPTTAPPLDVADVVEVMDLDKKRDETGLRMVLLTDIGHPIVRSVDGATVRAALAAVGIT